MKMKKIARPAFALLLSAVAITEATTRLVPDDYATIQGAIDGCNDGDVVIAAPGTYTGPGNRDIDFKGKAIAVKSEHGAASCIIDCQGSAESPHRGFYFHSGENADSMLCGFTIRNGYTQESGGGIFCYIASPRISDCIITANTAAEGGGGIAAVNSSVSIEDCIITSNAAFGMYRSPMGTGGGIMCSDWTSEVQPIFIRCTIAGNKTKGGDGGGVSLDGSATLVNCTLYGNRTLRREQFGGGLYCGFGHYDKAFLHNCIIWGNTSSYGPDIAVLGGGIMGTMFVNIEHSLVGIDPNSIFDPLGHIEGEWMSSDPLFVRSGYWDPNDDPDYSYDDFWVDGDYHLKSQAGRWDPDSKTWVKDNMTSPCIDADDPASLIGLEPFPNGGIINMGAYGGRAEASKSYFGEPVCETIVAGDINGNCKVDFADLMLIAAHWLDHKGQSPAPSAPPPENLR
jgi:hypothetical protein